MKTIALLLVIGVAVYAQVPQVEPQNPQVPKVEESALLPGSGSPKVVEPQQPSVPKALECLKKALALATDGARMLTREKTRRADQTECSQQVNEAAKVLGGISTHWGRMLTSVANEARRTPWNAAHSKADRKSVV